MCIRKRILQGSVSVVRLPTKSFILTKQYILNELL